MQSEESTRSKAAREIDAEAAAEGRSSLGGSRALRRILVSVAVVLAVVGAVWGGYAHWYRTLPGYEAPATRQPVPEITTEVRLIVLGDWGSGQRPQAWIAQAANDAAKGVGGVHGVISTGDNFYNKGVRSVDDPIWTDVFEHVYDTEWLGSVPWFVALGNHDYNNGNFTDGWGNARAQIEYTAKSKNHWNMPAEYFRKDFGPAGADPILSVFILDTNPWFTRHDEQAAWLDAELSSLADKPWHKLVVAHHPIHSVATQGGPVGELAVKHIEPLLRKHKVTLYLCGHHHTMQAIERDGMSYLVVGCSGKRLYDIDTAHKEQFAKKEWGFGLLRATRESISLDFLNRDGGLEHRWTKPVPTKPQ